MKKPLRAAVVGLGRIGWGYHAEQLGQRPDFKLVDVADPEPVRRREAAEKFGCGTHANLKELLAKTDADLVVLATPSSMHEQETLAVLRSGRHCVVEKPMAMSYSGAQRMIAAARKARKKLFVHHNFRLTNEFLHLREMVDSGLLGRIFEIRVCWFSFARRNDWQTLRKYGGGVLNNAGSHALDVVLNLLDSPPASVLSDLQHIKDAGNCEDHVHLLIKARNGRVADVTISTACALPSPKWMLLGTLGSLSSDGQTSTLKYYNPKSIPKLKAIEGPATNRRYDNDDVLPWTEETRPTKPQGVYGNFFDNVSAVLLKGEAMTITPESAAAVSHLIEWARRGTAFPKWQATSRSR